MPPENDIEERYPQHAALAPIMKESQACGDFLQWLADTKGWRLAVYDEEQDDCRNCGHETRHREFNKSGVWPDGCEVGDCTCRDVDKGNPNLLVHPPYRTEELLAEFFGIDWNELQAEKDKMFQEIQVANTQEG